MQRDDNGRGALFDNDDKQHERQPDVTGFLTVSGRRGRIAGWWRTSQGGKRYLSIAHTFDDEREDYREKRARPTRNYQERQGDSTPEPWDDEIPF